MQEGDTELGGLQIPHGNNVNPPTPTPGPQPAASAVPQIPNQHLPLHNQQASKVYKIHRIYNLSLRPLYKTII